MELPKNLRPEHVQFTKEPNIMGDIAQETQTSSRFSSLTEKELCEKIETILLEKIKNGEKSAYFQLGQLYFEQEIYDKARVYFERSKEFDFQSLYQLGVMYYDGLGCDAKPDEGVACLMKVATSKHRLARNLVHAAQYNTGKAYYQGYGVPHQSNNEAERWWLLAADDGNPKGSVKAQASLGMFYSCDGNLDLDKAFYWHSEACGNGSLESQGALGVMYEHKIGGRNNSDSAYVCLKEASDRGNVYAMGNLIAHYYRRKLYTKAADLTSKVSQYTDIQQIAKETDCLPTFIAKGIAMACFYYARCLALGHGMDKDKEEAKKYYSKSYQFDPDVCAQLQNITNHGVI